MLSGPPTAAMIASGAEVVVVIEGLSLVVALPAAVRMRCGTRSWDRPEEGD